MTSDTAQHVLRARGGSAPWILLIHQLPPKPAYLRVKVWRRLQQLGAVPIKNSVYILPNRSDLVEDFQWQRREIVAEGGEATICEAAFVDGLSDPAVEGLFRAAREVDYRALATAAQRLLQAARIRRRGTSLERIEGELRRLKRRVAEVVAVDFFGAPSRQAPQESIARIETLLESRRASPESIATKPSDQRPHGGTWVTREDVHVDRIASGWLIRRFIDPKARFMFVNAKTYRPKRGDLRFDMFDGEYTHEGNACTFETLVRRFHLTDPALRVIAEVVHDIDIKDAKFGRAETSGIERLLAGLAHELRDDATRLARGGQIFEGLYLALTEDTQAPFRRPGDKGRRRRERRRAGG
jgi:hypothetical protein